MVAFGANEVEANSGPYASPHQWGASGQDPDEQLNDIDYAYFDRLAAND